jgi:hypothetical protein
MNEHETPAEQVNGFISKAQLFMMDRQEASLRKIVRMNAWERFWYSRDVAQEALYLGPYNPNPSPPK